MSLILNRMVNEPRGGRLELFELRNLESDNDRSDRPAGVEHRNPDLNLLAELQLTPSDVVGKKFYRGRGCDYCNNTGYKARMGLYELMIMNDELRDMIMRNASTDDIRERAKSYGMVPLRDAGMDAVYAGTTTVEEVVRETIVDG